MMNLDDLTDNERTALAAIAQHEANGWVRVGTAIPVSFRERGRRALRWLEIAAMFNADYAPQEWVVETATSWANHAEETDDMPKWI